MGEQVQVIEDVRKTTAQLPGLVLTVGSFDGVHLGHRRILDRLLRQAREEGGTAGVMTLRPHPREFFTPRHAPNILTPPEKQEELLRDAGVNVLFVLPFNAEVANLERQVFLEEILLARCGAQSLVVGHDFAFGKGARGNYEYLRAVAPQYDLRVEQVPPLIISGERVSSTLIREYVLQGDLDQVERFLGRKYSLLGKVQSGRGIGEKLGYPTANIAPGNAAVPMHGIYVAEAIVGGRRWLAAVNIGIAPTIRHEDIMVEAHLLDFSGDLVNQTLELVFHKRLRPEKKFPSYEALSAAIADDVGAVRRYFSESRA